MMHHHPLHMQHQQHINRMMSADPDMIPPNLDDISQSSHQSSPDLFMEHPLDSVVVCPSRLPIRYTVVV
ncbi:hypothetical protein PFISCL1PPCAC_8330 [Pristionchus fissidentatus]|uniref:Uncharacterized protein n=1 Tax=Pristionchus fissidentatus TaxID=1538716 RepID=A0AAV5VFN2_9BILA|nr:hypothetical protein PFISCL1PPCAC_8330 [Pristionchus fissidentatus]